MLHFRWPFTPPMNSFLRMAQTCGHSPNSASSAFGSIWWDRKLRISKESKLSYRNIHGSSGVPSATRWFMRRFFATVTESQLSIRRWADTLGGRFIFRGLTATFRLAWARVTKYLVFSWRLLRNAFSWWNWFPASKSSTVLCSQSLGFILGGAGDRLQLLREILFKLPSNITPGVTASNLSPDTLCDYQ